MPWWKLSELAAEIRRLTATRAKRAVKLPCGAELAFGERMLLMGIINLTDDSFFGGSRCGGDADKAVAKAVKMAEDGADILDLGAESTRPGAPRVPEEQERERMSAAVAAGTRDPRFPAVEPDELDELVYDVDVLSAPEDISGPEQLDPARYGVIVSAPGGRRGVLLPDLDGVDTVAEQVQIAARKGGIDVSEPGVRLQRFTVTRHL